ncbi:LolA family protein [Paenibacillus arenosi]|uniref:DUF4367 domain-containing protein n=1 Tax=Paenibacillus arenosi TaxID=2774142 RepID=A0ABR9AUQ4_9BACL|nr:sigma-E factor regulatory protein RseB domain-containing protein [Paenibacillus arenosi]MBD8497851.1 DUF4367 domain-containing protein [Paenibacillus arenosi]
MRTKGLTVIKWIFVVFIVFSVAGCGWSWNWNWNKSEPPSNFLDMVTPPNYELVSYYAEANMTYTYKDGKSKDEKYLIKEWVDAKQGRVYREMIEGNKVHFSLQTPRDLLTYTKGDKVAYTTSFSPDDPEVSFGTRESFMMQMESIRKNYTIKSVEDDTFLGRPVQRLRAVAKDSSYRSEIELWIDKETWMVLKDSERSDEVEFVTEYTLFETRNKFEDKELELIVPSHVMIEEMDESSEPDRITLQEAAKLLKSGLMHLSQNQDIKLSHVEKEVYDFGEDVDWTLISLIYDKPDGTPMFQLYISPSANVGDNTSANDNKVKVRNKQGTYWEELQILSWEENGYLYELMSRHPDLKQDELLKWAEKLTPYPSPVEMKP